MGEEGAVRGSACGYLGLRDAVVEVMLRYPVTYSALYSSVCMHRETQVLQRRPCTVEVSVISINITDEQAAL